MSMKPEEDDFEELENELRAMVPHRPSAELRERIATQIKGIEAARPRRGFRALAVLSGLGIAACVGFAMLQLPIPEQHETSRRSAASYVAPTALNYMRAWSNSPEDLDRLLDEHARDVLQKSGDDEEIQQRSMLNRTIHGRHF